MSWHLNVPKILHVYWSADPMYYLRYMTVKSFIEQNPDWKVMLWLPKHPYKVVTWNTIELNYKKDIKTDYFPELLKLDIEVHYVDMEDYGVSNEISEVHKSDYLRYWVLYQYGGVYSDFDILYFKPIEHLKVNVIENADVETFVCISPRYGHSAGFYMASEGSLYFHHMHFKAKESIDSADYQSVGPNLVNKLFPTLESIAKVSNVQEIGMEAVYAHDGQHIPDLYSGVSSRFTENSIGCHWYAGHPLSGVFLNKTNGGLENLPNNIISNLL